mmetsp:Transcript_28135/g.60394  ORF Transcript_28135/g.60394 Transcript_28135/m.60394 type:complete len:225 (-) Transcript_28135:1811-2485(-)
MHRAGRVDLPQNGNLPLGLTALARQQLADVHRAHVLNVVAVHSYDLVVQLNLADDGTRVLDLADERRPSGLRRVDDDAELARGGDDVYHSNAGIRGRHQGPGRERCALRQGILGARAVHLFLLDVPLLLVLVAGGSIADWTAACVPSPTTARRRRYLRLFNEFHVLFFLPPAQDDDDQRGHEDACPTHYDDDRNLGIVHTFVLVFAGSFNNNRLLVFGNSNPCR